jgi:hypothetical protein
LEGSKLKKEEDDRIEVEGKKEAFKRCKVRKAWRWRRRSKRRHGGCSISV